MIRPRGRRSNHWHELAKRGHASQQDRVGRSAESQEEAMRSETGRRDKQHQSTDVFAQQEIDVFENIVHHRPPALLHQSRDELIPNGRSVLQEKERQNRNQHQVQRVLRAGHELSAQTLDIGQDLLSPAAQLVLHSLNDIGARWLQPRR